MKDNCRKKSRINLLFINKIIFCSIILLFAAFLISTNDLSIKGFVLNDMKIKLTDLQKENQKMELKITELQSYENIDKKAKERNMVKVEKIEYVSLAKEEIAKK